MTDERLTAITAREGSAFDAERARRASRSPLRRLKSWLSHHLVGIIAVIWPYLYRGYCRFVWWTSTVIDDVSPTLNEQPMRRHGRCVALLWHQEVFTVAWSYRNITPHTLASVGHFGRIITHMLERCGYIVFRGGSSAGTARRRRVLPLMIRHMQEEAEVLYGITVDGSNGPIYQLKGGMLVVARTCRAPIYLVRTWYRRRLELPTWDRTGVPLPFNDIVQLCIGPYWIPPDCSAQELERIREHLELELLDLCALSYRLVDGVDRVPEGFPAGWTPRWRPGEVGLAYGPHDFRPWDPPAWASVPGPQRAARRREREAPEDAGDDDDE